MTAAHESKPHGGLLALTVGAMGVVYGDIGTSPLYAVNEIFFGHNALAATHENVVGAISLILWTITVVVLFKYLVFVLRADNDGEGGTFALYGLLHKYKRRGIGLLLWLLMLAAGLLFGEGIITPAISVLSAVEGVKIVTPALDHAVVPITLAILTALFLVQRHGTAKMGTVFGPIILCWFTAIGVFGVLQLWDRWGVLPKNIVFVEVVHKKVPYVHHARYEVTQFQRSAERGGIFALKVTFGFMEEPNVEHVLAGVAAHHEVDLPREPEKWVVHVSQENAMLAKDAGALARLRLRLFGLLRQVSTPAYYYYGLGNDVQLSSEILPVRLR